MPLARDLSGDRRESGQYCSYYYAGGKFTYLGNDIKEFNRGMINTMVANGNSKMKAKFFVWMDGFAPRLKEYYGDNREKSGPNTSTEFSRGRKSLSFVFRNSTHQRAMC